MDDIQLRDQVINLGMRRLGGLNFAAVAMALVALGIVAGALPLWAWWPVAALPALLAIAMWLRAPQGPPSAREAIASSRGIDADRRRGFSAWGQSAVAAFVGSWWPLAIFFLMIPFAAVAIADSSLLQFERVFDLAVMVGLQAALIAHVIGQVELVRRVDAASAASVA